MQVYCLPDNYEVVDRSLDDIRAVLDPSFNTEVRSRGRGLLQEKDKQQVNPHAAGRTVVHMQQQVLLVLPEHPASKLSIVVSLCRPSCPELACCPNLQAHSLPPRPYPLHKNCRSARILA